jgi:hypothetical protein
MLKAALNRAFHTDRVPTDMAWRKVKPFKRVDEAVVRYLTAAEARRLLDQPARLSGSEIAHHGPVDALEWFDLAPGHIRWHPVGVEGTVGSRFQHCEESVGGRLAGAPRVCG